MQRYNFSIKSARKSRKNLQIEIYLVGTGPRCVGDGFHHIKLFLTHPEVNPLAVAKRLGINPGLMTHYINGTRKPSKDCESKIYNEIKVIGESLAAIGS